MIIITNLNSTTTFFLLALTGRISSFVEDNYIKIRDPDDFFSIIKEGFSSSY